MLKVALKAIGRIRVMTRLLDQALNQLSGGDGCFYNKARKKAGPCHVTASAAKAFI